jgi:UrcA family protein
MHTPPRKTKAFKIYAAPVALLLMAGLLAPAPAAADAMPRDVKVVTTTFTFDRNAPAAEIHADLSRKVERLCRMNGPRPTIMRKYDELCMTSAMSSALDGISRIGRVDVAQHHVNVG